MASVDSSGAVSGHADGYTKDASADNKLVFHGREVRKVPDAAGGMAGRCTLAPRFEQGLTLVLVRAQLEHIRGTFMGQVGSRGTQRQLKLS